MYSFLPLRHEQEIRKKGTRSTKKCSAEVKRFFNDLFSTFSHSHENHEAQQNAKRFSFRDDVSLYSYSCFTTLKKKDVITMIMEF